MYGVLVTGFVLSVICTTLCVVCCDCVVYVLCVIIVPNMWPFL